MEITLDVKKLFFDRQKVINAVERKQKWALSRSGFAIRRHAKRSLRRRRRPSRPGRPPSIHMPGASNGLKKIYYVYDPRSKGLVVGPVKLPRSSDDGVQTGQPAPGFLEFGGDMTVRPTATRPNRRTVRHRIAARPFMGPALTKAEQAGEILSPWANVVSG